MDDIIVDDEVVEVAKKNKNKKKTTPTPAEETGNAAKQDLIVEEDGTYTGKDEVALYIHTYGHLPSNFITKKEAKALGWESSKGNLEDVAPGKSIGGDRFGNYEGQLPQKEGRTYTECDIEFEGGYRDAKRIIFSNDGLIFYTEDHYQSFEQLY
ncbi:MAG: ribonuclease [Blautia sp.]|nr:ribonuclease [Blautia sp.]